MKLTITLEGRPPIELDVPIAPPRPPDRAKLVDAMKQAECAGVSWHALRGVHTDAALAFIAANQGAGEVGHPDDLAVDQFAVTMKRKLAEKRAQGYGGWERVSECPPGKLSKLLHRAVAKGDPVNVANFAMMLHHRGERIDAGEARYVVPTAVRAFVDAHEVSGPSSWLFFRAADGSIDNASDESFARERDLWLAARAAIDSLDSISTADTGRSSTVELEVAGSSPAAPVSAPSTARAVVPESVTKALAPWPIAVSMPGLEEGRATLVFDRRASADAWLFSMDEAKRDLASLASGAFELIERAELERLRGIAKDDELRRFPFGGVSGEARAESAERRASDAEAGLASVLADLNALVKASGSPTNGGAVGHVAALASRATAAEAKLASVEAERDGAGNRAKIVYEHYRRVLAERDALKAKRVVRLPRNPYRPGTQSHDIWAQCQHESERANPGVEFAEEGA